MLHRLGILWAVVVVAGSSAADAQRSATDGPNVLVVLLDDVGTEKLKAYGQGVSFPPTPTFDALRESGVLFTNAYVNPLCGPTRALVQTGRYAFRTGMGANPGSELSLPSKEATIAELLRDGFVAPAPVYARGAFGKWHLTRKSNRMHPISNGYERFVGPMGNVSNHYSWAKVASDASGTKKKHVGSVDGPFDETTFSASVVRSDALTWINAQPRPFFAYVGFNPPHAPWQVPPLTTVSPATAEQITAAGYAPGDDLGDGPSAVSAYDWMIEATDTELGRLIAGIAPAVREQTMIIVLADNGTPMELVEAPFDPTHAKGSVHRLGVRVPMVVTGPLVNHPGSTCGQLVSGADVWATVAAVTGADAGLVTLAGPSDSVSFMHLIMDPAAPSGRPFAFSQRFKPKGPYEPSPTAAPAKDLHLRCMTDGAYTYHRRSIGGAYVEEAYYLPLDDQEAVDLFPAFLTGTLSPAAMTAIAGLMEATTQLSGF